jgi:lysophospholipase L1-like esterase
MIAKSKALSIVLAAVPAVLLPAAVHAQTDTHAAEFSSAEFAKADEKHMPPPGGVLFVGSSSIRLWDNLEQQFNTAPVVVKRGFGGSRMEDCTAQLSRLVIPYKPRVVVVYAGENDLAEGRLPDQVLRSFATFVNGVRAKLPNTRIAYVSIKPSIARQQLLAKIRATNALIRNYVAGLGNAEYIDVFTPMLDKQGAPRADLFREDKLHMNAAGYAIWQAAIAPAIK